MSLLSLKGIKKGFGDLEVLKGVYLEIGKGDKIGLVGKNGAGKTTLANILAGLEKADEGMVLMQEDEISIGYLRQSTQYSCNTFNEIFEREHRAEKLENFLEVAGHLGLEKVRDWDPQRLDGLSGGEKTKLALAQVWITMPDVLMLDEPTNHMDFKGVEWLAGEIAKYKGAVITISHDRYFLDRVTNRIVELENGVAANYTGNYTAYRDEKKRRFESQLRLYTVEKKRQEKIEEEIARWKDWSAKAHREAGKKNIESDGKQMGAKEYGRKKAKKMDIQIKSRVKRLEKMRSEETEKPREEAKILFDFESAGKRGRRILEARNIAKGFDGRILFKETSFFIRRGEKVGVFGENGCGKTTLLKTILGQERVEHGEVWVSPTAQIVYLSQDVDDLNGAMPATEVLNITRHTRDGAAWTLLANMGFDEAMLKKPVKCLSLGEKTRIKIAKMILAENDFIILDEPTNHLDLASREQLENTLKSYDGTLLIVSHDRYMLEGVCDKLLVFEEGQIVRLDHGFKEYWEKPDVSAKSGTDTLGDVQEERMLIENRISAVLGELSSIKTGDPRYAALDEEFKRLVERKKQLYSTQHPYLK